MKTRVTKNQLFGKLVIGLAGIFMLFVLAGCEKEKSVTGPTASTTTKKTAIKFQKTNPDSIPLTVVVNGCDMPTIKLCSGEPQKNDYWKVYTPDWKRRTSLN